MPLWPRRSVTQPPAIRQPPPPVPDHAPPHGTPVNPFSRAVQPREQFPLHFDLLMRDLFKRGDTPEDWQVIAADEARLDEDGMDVEFTLLRAGTNQVWRRRVDVKHGKLVEIRDC